MPVFIYHNNYKPKHVSCGSYESFTQTSINMHKVPTYSSASKLRNLIQWTRKYRFSCRARIATTCRRLLILSPMATNKLKRKIENVKVYAIGIVEEPQQKLRNDIFSEISLILYIYVATHLSGSIMQSGSAVPVAQPLSPTCREMKLSTYARGLWDSVLAQSREMTYKIVLAHALPLPTLMFIKVGNVLSQAT